MTTALSQRRDHLDRNRRMIIARSLAAAAVGSIPIPLVEDWLSGSIKKKTFARIAESHAVDVDKEALRELTEGARRGPEWSDVAGGTLAGRLLSRTWRRLLLGVVVARRAQVAGHNFLLATLFDHYCARLHVGLGLDEAAATQLRLVMAQAVSETRGGLSRHLFRKAIRRAARASARAPLELADRASGGALRRMLTRGDETVAAAEVDEELERELANQNSFLARSALAVELQLSADRNQYVDRLVDTFERLWRSRGDEP